VQCKDNLEKAILTMWTAHKLVNVSSGTLNTTIPYG